MKRIIVTFFLLLSISTTAQVIYGPLYRSVYSYLSRISQKGIINLEDVVLPISRKYVVQHLSYLQQNDSKLTPLEIKELALYLKEYTQALNLLLTINKKQYIR